MNDCQVRLRPPVVYLQLTAPKNQRGAGIAPAPSQSPRRLLSGPQAGKPAET